MRRNRIILFICFCLTLIAISFYGGPVSYGFFCAVLMIPVISLLYILCVIAQFKIYQRLDSRYLIANRTSNFYFTLQNESVIPFSGIRVLYYSSFSTINGLEDAVEYELSPHTGIKKQTELVCRYRGEYEVGIKKIMVQDFFRLFCIAYRIREPLRVTVKPNIVFLPSLKAEQQSVNSSKDCRIHLSQPDVVIREYEPYDDRRLIHWRATAAMQKLMVRERIDEQQKGVAIVMTPKRISKKIETYLPVENKILETVIALAHFYSSRTIPVSVYEYSGRLNEFCLNEHRFFDAFYEKMSEYIFDEDRDGRILYDDILKTGTIFEKRAVYLVVYEWDLSVSGFVKTLSRRGLSIIVYIISDHEINDAISEHIPRCEIFMIPTDADLMEVM